METTDLPDGYFWDTEEAEQQYHEFEQRIVEAEQKFAMAKGRVLCALALTECFRNAFKTGWHDTGNHDSLSFAELASLQEKERCNQSVREYLHLPFNHAWLSLDGRVKSLDGEMLESIERNMVLHKVESETVKGSGSYWMRTRIGWGYREKVVQFTYPKRVERYSIKNGAAITGVEYALRHQPWPFDATGGPTQYGGELLFGDMLRQESDEVQKAVPALFRELLEELILDVRARAVATVSMYLLGKTNLKSDYYYLASMVAQEHFKEAVFYPDLAPEVSENGTLIFPPLAQVKPPGIGERWNVPGWMGMGRWKVLELPGVESMLVIEEEALHEQVIANVKDVYAAQDELKELQQQKKELRIRHYKPVAYKVFWAAWAAALSRPDSTLELSLTQNKFAQIPQIEAPATHDRKVVSVDDEGRL